MRKLVIIISFLIGFCTFIPGSARAESPFSALGYGLLFEASSARSAGMGFTSLITPDSLIIDSQTPALWSGPPTARFGVRAGLTRTLAEDETGSDVSDLGLPTGVAMAIPIGRERFFGVTISPVTRMAYRWELARTSAVNPDWYPIIEQQQGRGGITQGLIGFSSPLGASARIGLGVRTIFGKVEKLWKLEFPSSARSNSASHTRSDRFTGLGASISSILQLNEYWLTGFSINSPVSVKIQNRTLVVEGNTSVYDVTRELEENYDMPWDVRIAICRKSGRHVYGFETAWHGWGQVDNPPVLAINFKDAVRISTGWEYSPVFKPFDPFWRSFIYRSGFYYQEHYITSSTGHQAARFGFTSGFGLPYNENKSRVDIAFEIGWMGSVEKDGASESFGSVTIGINHSELWFIGRKERRRN